MSNIEEQNQSLLSTTPADFSYASRSETRQEDIVSSNFPCNFLYACENCDGHLAPNAICIVCKRASVRTCLHCQKCVITGTHLSCSALFFFAKDTLHTRQFSKGVKL